MRNVGVHLNLCDCADQFGDECNFMSCSHRVELEHLELLNESVVPVFVAVIAIRDCLRVTRK